MLDMIKITPKCSKNEFRNQLNTKNEMNKHKIALDVNHFIGQLENIVVQFIQFKSFRNKYSSYIL